jgi:L-ribulose-5-phosphate 3-epimerase
MIEKIGFMQGRLSPMIGGKIQSFPWDSWRHEIVAAKSIDISIMEWTLDQERLYENPIMTSSGQREIISLCRKHDFSIPSLTGDCFMQAPFWKVDDAGYREKLKADFKAIIKSCSNIGLKFVVVPLVDGGSLDGIQQENILVEFLLQQQNKLKELGVRIIFESDFVPVELYRFISQLDSDVFGINYDIGNSASLGLNPSEEFKLMGDRILNVHVKDRVLNGTTVPLGQGNADFNTVYSCLKSHSYDANYILQTARATDDQHLEVLLEYKKFVQNGFN